MDYREMIKNGKTALGIELGSTRIKAQLVAQDGTPLASGAWNWENQLVDGIWTYSLEDGIRGMQGCYQDMAAEVEKRHGVALSTVGAMGISAMMHGYLAFDQEGRQLAPFRTWRNGTTGESADQLTRLFGYNIPQRWSIAHLYQAVLNQEGHVKDMAFLTTLAGYVHWQLSGRKVLGVGDASGMFPINPATRDYDKAMVEKFDRLMAPYGYSWKLMDILPTVLAAGDRAGTLTREGARLLDASGRLEAGIPLCPPEGDAGTGMVATNSVAWRTGNLSAGTSVFSMVVLEQPLKRLHKEIDMVATPEGRPVAMVHANNCTSDLNAWVGMFQEFASLFGLEAGKQDLYGRLYRHALEGDADCGGLVSYGYCSGENITHCPEGRPLLARMPDAHFTLANVMRAHLYGAVAALKIGMDVLTKEEQVSLDVLMGHGGFFKTREVGQRIMAAAMGVPIAVMETAGEGGPWGMALLAAYLAWKKPGERLDQYLADKVFADMAANMVEPDQEDVAGFEAYMKLYQAGIGVEQEAVRCLQEK